MSEIGPSGNYDQKKTKWVACDFCRVKKPTKFKSEHIEVTSTDEGIFQGPTCSLSVYNTEVHPLPEAKKAELSLKAENVSQQSTSKKKKKTESKNGMTIAKLEKEQQREYEEKLREVRKVEKYNRKIAMERQKKKEHLFLESLGPRWYQALSYKQMMYLEMLGESLKFDLQEGILTRTLYILAGLGIYPRPPIKEVSQAVNKCFMNPILFLLYMYKHIGKTPLKPAVKYFCLNDRLILSSIAYLALPRTILELDCQLPLLPSKDIEEYPAKSRRKKKIYKSPYSQPHPFFQHCYRKEERKENEKRKLYLKKIREQKKETEKKEESEIATHVRTTESSPGRPTSAARSLGFSTKHDAADQIPTLAQLRASTRTSARVFSLKRKKHTSKNKEGINVDVTGNKRSESHSDSEDGSKCESEIECGQQNSELSDKDEKIVTVESETYTKNMNVKCESSGGLEEDSEIIVQNPKKGRLNIRYSDINEEIYLYNESSTNFDTKNATCTSSESIKENGNSGTPKAGSSDIITHLEPHDSAPLSFPLFPETEAKPAEQTRFPPFFISLESQLAHKADRKIKPVFPEITCGYPPPSEKVSEIETELVEESRTEILLRQDFMQLPYPIPTRPTIRAVLGGYWQQVNYSNKPTVLQINEDVTKTGVKETYYTLVKKILSEMAKNGNPLACLPKVHMLPQIRQLVHERTNFKLTRKFKEKLMLQSYQQWNETIENPRRVPIIPLKIDKERMITWESIRRFKKLVNMHADDYRSKVRQALVDDARELWATMCMDYFNNPRFCSIYFSYIPSKEEDIYSIKPWD